MDALNSLVASLLSLASLTPSSPTPLTLAAVALLLLGRLLPLVWLTPWLAPAGTGVFVALSVTAMLWITLLPHALLQVTAVPLDGVGFVFALGREVLLGAAFAVVVRLPLEAMTWAGSLVSRAAADQPWTDPSQAPLAALYRWLGVVLFVVAGGAEFALSAVAAGLDAVPVGQLLSWSSWSDLQAVTFSFVALCASAITLGLLLAMPVMLGLLVVHVAQWLGQRWFAEWPSSQLWLPLRQVMAVALALLSLSLVASALPDAYAASIVQARSLLRGLTP